MSRDLHLVIANKAYSSWSLRPWLAMAANGIAFRETVIGLQRDDTPGLIKQYSPSGKVPVLIDGAAVVWESLAILEYLSETFPAKAWWPAEPAARAYARAAATEMHAGFVNLRVHMPMNLRRVVSKSTTAAVDADIARIAAIWRECRTRFGEGKGAFLFGAFTNADAMYAPIVTRFKTYGVRLDPVCEAYADAILTMPAMKDWYAAAAAESWVVAKYEEAADTP